MYQGFFYTLPRKRIHDQSYTNRKSKSYETFYMVRLSITNHFISINQQPMKPSIRTRTSHYPYAKLHDE